MTVQADANLDWLALRYVVTERVRFMSSSRPVSPPPSLPPSLKEPTMSIVSQPVQNEDNLGQTDEARPSDVVTMAADLPPRELPPAAQRALAEAEERRQLRDAAAESRPTEVGGRGGPDPVRFGDWEKGGICWDF
jgi:hypothetical protein